MESFEGYLLGRSGRTDVWTVLNIFAEKGQT